MNSWIWLLLAVLFTLIETFTLGLTTCWFVIGAIVAFLAAWFGVSWEFQVIIFLATAIILLLFLRPLAKDYFKIGAIKSGIPALIGKTGIVEEKIVPPLSGVVTIIGQIWTAEAATEEIIEVGAKVQIVDIEGVILIVKKA
jgi:membrane protein implicated in regulation of membrane protease activity